MQNTLEQTAFDIIQKKLQQRIDDKTTFVAKGAAEDYANYRERVGELNELKAILEIFESTVKAIDPY